MIFGDYFWGNALFLGKQKSRKALILLDFLGSGYFPKNRPPKNSMLKGNPFYPFYGQKFYPMKSQFHRKIHVTLPQENLYLRASKNSKIGCFAQKHEKRPLEPQIYSKALRVSPF